jgi:hypothetical protein
MKQIVLLLAFALLLLSCKKNAISVVSLPNVSTSSITSVRETSAMSGGDVVSTGNSVVEVRGVCWSTSHNPTVTADTTMDDRGAGIFVSRITHLMPSTTYFLRAYASNNVGTAYGMEDSFTTASPPFSAIGYYSGEIVSGTVLPHGTPIGARLTNDSPVSGFIYVNGGTYPITGGSFNTPHLLVSSVRSWYGTPHWVNKPWPHWVVDSSSTSWSVDGQLVDFTWSGTINLTVVNSHDIQNFSGDFICQRQ